MTRTGRGQALIEMAVFGAVALASLGFLIRIGMKMNFDQEIRMAAFRKALAAAKADNGTDQDATAVIYHYIADRQMPNPTDGFMTMPRNRTEASAFVEWGDRLTATYDKNPDEPDDRGRKTQPRYFVRVNGDEHSYRMEEFPRDYIGQWGDYTVSVPAFHGIIRESATSNTSNGTMTTTKSGSRVSSHTGTCSDTTVNTLNSDIIQNCISAPAAGVSW